MHIAHLEIENFRGIGHISLDLEDNRPVVLIGDNGTGKSSVLDALSLALMDLDGQLKQLTETPIGIADADIRIGTMQAFTQLDIRLRVGRRIEWTIASRPVTLEPKYAIPHEPSISSDAYVLERPIVVCYPTIRRVRHIPLTPDANEESGPPWSFALDVAGRPVGSAISQQYAKISSFQTDEIDFRSFFIWFRLREDLENESRINDSRYRDTQLQAVRQSVEGIMPGYKNFRVRRNPDSLVLTKGVAGSETLFNIHQMSDGEKGLIALVGHFPNGQLIFDFIGIVTKELL